MNKIGHKIGFIGAGNMGDAMIGAMVRSGITDPSQIFVHEIRDDQANALKSKYGITILADNCLVIRECDIIVFAVKPQSLDQILDEISARNIFANLTGRKLIISIAAGKRMSKFEDYIYNGLNESNRKQFPILRVMPNTPALVGAGMSALCANKYADSNDIEIAKILLLSMGKVIECQEKDMDAVTAMSGSGPAYCFYVIEAMIQAGVNLGFSLSTATQLTVTTFKGALELLEQQSIPPAELRRKVTSPGGTTEAAVKILDEQNVQSAIMNAVQAAALRSKELSA